MAEKLSRTMTVPEAAALVGVSMNSYYRAFKAGEVPGLRIGGRIVVPRVALERFLGEQLGDE